MRIKDVHTKVILDSRGHPTLETQMQCEHYSVHASVPSGKSTGVHAVANLHPTDAVEKLKEISRLLCEKDFASQNEFDQYLCSLDGTDNKSNLGGNLILSLSLAFARAFAAEQGVELYEYVRSLSGESKERAFPRPIFNVINGGAHVSPSDDWIMRNGGMKLTFQEFQVIPMVDDYTLALSLGKEFYHKLGGALLKRFDERDVFLGDEAGFVAPFENNEDALEFLYELINTHRYPLAIGLDVAASQFFDDGKYEIGNTFYTSGELRELYADIVNRYDIFSVEDPFDEEDFSAFAYFTNMLAGDEQERLVITDDLTTTNASRLDIAIKKGAGNAILVKLNQIGTLSETLDVIKMAHRNGWKAVVSHRSGETLDDFIGDLAVGAGVWGLKSGAPARPERMAKYDRVLEIAKRLQPEHK